MATWKADWNRFISICRKDGVPDRAIRWYVAWIERYLEYHSVEPVHLHLLNCSSTTLPKLAASCPRLAGRSGSSRMHLSCLVLCHCGLCRSGFVLYAVLVVTPFDPRWISAYAAMTEERLFD